VEIKQQFHDLDTLVIFNNEVAIVIEDKTYTSEHSNQLKRFGYIEALKKGEYRALLK
jgi:hypothetical protein